jgi:anti-sigma B factor antagonist
MPVLRSQMAGRLTPHCREVIVISEAYHQRITLLRTMGEAGVGVRRTTFPPEIDHNALFLTGKRIMASGQRRLDIDTIGEVTIARFIDKKILDESVIQSIGNQLFGLVEEDGRQRIILDFSNVEYLSSAALGKLITMDKKVKAAGGKLRLCSIRPDIYEVFAITKLNQVFDITDDQDQAIEGF